jgi:hypothetical protein
MVAACNAGMQTQSTQRLVRLPCAVPWSLVAGARARRAPAVIIFRFCLRGTLYVMYDMCYTFCFLIYIYRKVQSRDRDSCLRTHVRKRE